MGSKKSYQIPFSRNGSLLTYPEYEHQYVGPGNGDRGHDNSILIHPPVWKDNYEFTGTLEFDHFSRGRSAAHAIFKDPSDDTEYTMFLTDLGDAIPNMGGGFLIGTFTFVKRGQNYGIKFLG